MNFYEHKDRARRATRLLLALFALAVAAIVGALGLIVWVAGGGRDAVLWTMGLTTGLILLASLYRTFQLRSAGGRAIASELEGSLVDGAGGDPQRRQLLNVVEEMAIASGVPVPEVYVLEQEVGINAFVAGWSPGDAVLAVTRGAVDSLNRAELKGVVAHEFGHMLNGDMRLNMRLIGVLYGIEALALIGQGGVARGHHSLHGASRRQGEGVLSITLLVVGYAGLLLARWIRAGVSRQREYLADAHAVQFTREPEGVAGALKKVAALHAGLNGNTEKISHMLFASDPVGQLFATHPPLEERIRRLQPYFDPGELEGLGQRVRAKIQRAMRRRAVEAMRQQRTGEDPDAQSPAGALAEALGGHPALAQVLGAGALLAAIPGPLVWAARSPARAGELVLYLLMHPDPEVRERQLAMIARVRGAESGAGVRELLALEPEPRAEQRLPLLEVSLPALRRRPRAEREQLTALIEQLIHADGRVAVHEYALGRLLTRYLDEARPGVVQHPRERSSATLKQNHDAARFLLGVLAYHGHPDDPAAARAALTAGIGALTGTVPVDAALPAELSAAAAGRAWASLLDRVLEQLDRLRPDDKDRLIRAMVATVGHRGGLVTAEVELLRVMAASLHVPLPLPGFADPGDADAEGAG